MENKKKILFLTGTRADYGKLKSLMLEVDSSSEFECHIFVTGMHTLKEFGDTRTEVINDGFKNVHTYMNQIIEEPMDLVLANTINGFGRFIRELEPDMIVIHGDRVEALAGAACGAINNIIVAHIEGGEISGTIDESIRHAISKFAHIHFVSNENAKKRLIQLGESEEFIFVIGSPDIDAIVKKPSIDFNSIKKRYEFSFSEYGILLYHPVTTEIGKLSEQIKQVVDAVIESGDNFIVVHPNNDTGHKIILDEYKRFKDLDRIRVFSSIRFEFFLEILKNANYILGNSSAGIHEAPVIGLTSINIGTRQNNRFSHMSILNTTPNKEEILKMIKRSKSMHDNEKTNFFGDGNSSYNFIQTIKKDEIWNMNRQKKFNDIEGE